MTPDGIMMNAAICEAVGENSALRVGPWPRPEAGRGQLLVRVAAASINFPDLLVTQDRYQLKAAPPFVLGAEAAGVVVAVGEGVSDVAPGDRVVFMGAIGAFADYAACDRGEAFVLPPEFPLDLAAGFGVAYSTAYLALVTQGRVQAGETVLVLGAAGGVGLATIEVARALGARVIAAASTPKKRQAALAAGADEAIGYDAIKADVMRITDGRGTDVAVDIVGDRHAEAALRALGWQGRYLVVGFAAGAIPRLPANLLLLKSASAIGVVLGAWAARDPTTAANNFAAILALYAQGRLHPRIHARYPLSAIRAALAEVGERRAIGKVIVDIETDGSRQA